MWWREMGAPLPGGFAGRVSSQCRLAQQEAPAAGPGSSQHSSERPAGWGGAAGADECRETQPLAVRTGSEQAHTALANGAGSTHSHCEPLSAGSTTELVNYAFPLISPIRGKCSSVSSAIWHEALRPWCFPTETTPAAEYEYHPSTYCQVPKVATRDLREQKVVLTCPFAHSPPGCIHC